jgi:hypothetical protein
MTAMTAMTVRRPKKFNLCHMVWGAYPANRADCRIESPIIRLLNINTTIAHTCPSTFGSQGSQETLPDECEARVTS